MSDTAEILEQAARWREAGKGVALATVVTTWGSSPRPIGAKLAVDDDGAMVGSVSGGCVEGAVVGEALASDPRRQAAAARFRGQRRAGLGSRARLRRQDPDLCRARRMKGRILDARRRRRPRAPFGGAGHRDRHRPRNCCSTATPPRAIWRSTRRRSAAMREALRADRNRSIETAAGRVFIEVFSPPRRCFVIGAVHIAQPLVQMLSVGRLRGDGDRSARRVCHRGAFSRGRVDPGMARRGAGTAAARPAPRRW